MQNEINQTILFSKLYEIYKINKKSIWMRVIILTILIACFSFVKPHTFESNVSLMPPKQSEGGGLSSILQNVSGGLASGLGMSGIGQSSQGQLFSDVLSSRTVVQYIIDSLKLNKIPQYEDMTRNELIKEVQEMFEVDVPRSGIIVFSVKAKTGLLPFAESKHKTAKLAADIASLAVAGLDKTVRERITSKARKSKEYVEREIISYRRKLDSIDNLLETFQKANKVLKIEDQTQALVKQTIEIGLQLAKAETELRVSESEYSANHPIVKQLRETVSQLKSQYERSQSGGVFGNDEFSLSFDEIPNLARQYANIIRDKKIFEQIILYLETQHHQEAIEESKDVPVVQILDNSLVADEHVAPNKKVMIAFGFIISFVFVYLYYLLRLVAKKQF